MPQIFANPAVLLAFYDPLFWTGEHKIYDWQIRIHRDFADKLPGKATRMCVAANNGSGKSKYLIGPGAVWTSLFPKALSVVTSSSGSQLDLQSMRSVKNLAEHINAYHGVELFECQYRHTEFKPTGSFIEARITDEPGRMEGFHPQEPGREFSVFVDEGKSIKTEMYEALVKWTGYTRRMDVSSAGPPFGTFYTHYVSPEWKSYRIQASDCPHLSKDEIDGLIATYGEKSAIIQTTLFSNFSNFFDGSLVMTFETVQRCLRMAKEEVGGQPVIPWRKEEENRAGLDSSGGGDEMILSVWNGNKQLVIESIDAKDSVVAVDQVVLLCRKWGLNNPAKRRADGGGNAKPILDMLARKGFPFVRIFNQVPPADAIVAKSYANRGTEMWYKFARLMEDCRLIPLPDPTQTNQLASRHLKRQVSTNKLMLEPKPEARANGHPSPDRADAAVLAMDHYSAEDKPKTEERKRHWLTPEQMAEYIDRINDREFDQPDEGSLTLEHLVGMRKSTEGTKGLLFNR